MIVAKYERETMNKDIFTTSRITGLLYLALAFTGMYAFLFAKTNLYVAGDAVATMDNLVTQEGLARMGIAAELALVGFQALAAVWFFKLFRKTDLFAAVSLMTFGMVNAVGILISNAFWWVALETALAGGAAEQVLILFDLHDAVWLVSSLFFGLWLIPMGYLAIKARMIKYLGWMLMIGGGGYVLSAFLKILSPSLSAGVIEGLTIPATIGEFWMIGYLLVKKVKA